MATTKVEFLKRVCKVEDLPPILENRKKIVFVGCSDLGKSSLLNYLMGRDIASVSKTSGTASPQKVPLPNKRNL
jgi:GTP-binding protein EngB required for normal cell division